MKVQVLSFVIFLDLAKMIYKKGQSTWMVIGALIAIFILGVVIYFLFSGGGKKITDYLGNVVPGFGTTNTSISSFAEVRYDTKSASGPIQYYDGTTWQNFKGGQMQSGNKVFDESEISKAFGLYLRDKQYYDSMVTAALQSQTNPTATHTTLADAAKFDKTKQPVSVTYKLNGNSKTESFCVTTYGDYLVIRDLNSPSTSQTCP